MMKETLTECLKIILGNITPNELQVEAVRGSVKILKGALWNEAMRTKLHSLVHES